MSSSEDDDRPLLPDDLAQLNEAVSLHNEDANAARDLRPTLEKYFKKFEVSGETGLESEWLTKQWKLAKGRQVRITDPATVNFAQALTKIENGRRKKILSRHKDE